MSVSSHRIKRAEAEGVRAFQATGGNPHLTENPYTRYSAQWYAFNRGWNRARKDYQMEVVTDE